jgi:flagellar basal-body rod protein FlgG
MNAQQLRIDNIANNLANVSTVGFKKSRESFEDLVYQGMPVGNVDEETERPTSLAVGTGTRLVAMSRDFSNGDLQYTGNPLDIGIGGRGFFTIEGNDGIQRYTRDGQLQVNRDGELVTQAGYQVSPGIEVPMDALQIMVAEDGTVSAVYEDATEAVTLGTLEIVDFVNSSGLRNMGGNLYTASPTSGEPIPVDPSEGTVRIQQGFLEASNVDVAEELVTLIVAQRSFELTSKVVQTADETLEIVARLK